MSKILQITKKPTVIDLFSGAGGLTLAALNSGANVLGAIEKDAKSCETYRKNFIENRSIDAPVLIPDDILDIEPAHLLKACGIKAGELDLLLGGPPCQGFSEHRLNGSGINDQRNRLILTYTKFVKSLAPKIFLIENVPGLLWTEHSYYLDALKSFCVSSNYRLLAPIVLNAKDFGVPQNRKRVFLVGIKSDFVAHFPDWPPKQSHFSPSSDEVLKEGKPGWITTKVVFNKPLKSLNEDPNSIRMQHGPDLTKVIESTPLDGGSRKESNRTLPCHQEHSGHKDVYGRMRLDAPSPTMTTACTNPSKGRFLHPTEHHGISLRHAARFQTFPDTFIFVGGITAASKQVGNAVPIKLGEAVLRPLIGALQSSHFQLEANGEIR